MNLNQDSERRTRPSTSRRSLIFRLLALSIGLAVGLAVAEFGLRLVEKYQLGDRGGGEIVSDPELGVRIVPNSPGHDANGFRNAVARPQADIVAIGDSQTWGVNVQGLDAWPQQLEKITQRPVYNMSVSGYGPVQYRQLIPRALKFSPKVIVVGLYFGNDLYDAYSLTYANEKYADLRSNSPPDLKNDTIRARADSYWNEEKDFHHSYGRNSISGLSFWLREHSATGRLLNRAGLWPGATDVDFEIDKAWAQTNPDYGLVCEDRNIRTVFTIAYRLTGLNLDDPHINEGLRITKLALWGINEQATQAKVKLIVLLIPTKESVYAEQMNREGRSTESYVKLVGMEQKARQEVLNLCRENQIDCVDTQSELRNAIELRQQIYPSTTESHPNAAGYRILALKVSEAIKN
jgi:lysophospholipase L1-like esterase